MKAISGTPRTLWIRRSMEVGFILLLVAGLHYSWTELQAVRTRVADSHAALERAPHAALEHTLVENQLERYAHDISRIAALLPPAEAVGDIVATFEAESVQRGLELRIPEINEYQVLDSNGNLVPVTGPFLDIELSFEVRGDPATLVGYLHALEHVPYVVRLPRWTLRTLPPLRLPSGDGEAGAAPAPITGVLSGNILITVRQDDAT